MKRSKHQYYVKFLIIPIIMLFSLMAVSVAGANNITFTRDKDGNNNAARYNLRVVIEQQTNSPPGRPATKVKGDCLIPQSGENCTIENFPNTTNALVTVYHVTNSSGAQGSVIGKIAFWVQISGDAQIHIPTGVASIKANKSSRELAEMGCCDISILPQATIEMGESFSGRPNSGSQSFGLLIGTNCEALNLGNNSDSTCTIDLLAGCYSPVFARPKTEASKAKIWVNRAENDGANTSLCVNEGQTTDYIIKVQ